MPRTFPSWVAIWPAFLGLLGCSPSATPETVGRAPEISPGSIPDSGKELSHPAFRALSGEEARARVASYLVEDEKLAHRVFEGPFGPEPDTIVVVYERGGVVGAFVVMSAGRRSRGGDGERTDLPDLSEGMLERVLAVAFMDVDEHRGPEAVIMTEQMTGAGLQAAIPRNFNAVVAWDGTTFVRLGDIEERIYDKKTAAEIRATLKAR